MLRTIKSKIAFLNVAILAMVLVAYSLIVFGLLTHLSLRNIDKTLEIKVQEMSSLINSFVRPQGVVMNIQTVAGRVIMRRGLLGYEEVINDQLARRILETLDLYELRDDYSMLFTVDGKEIASSENTPPEVLDNVLKDLSINPSESYYKDIRYGKKPLRMHVKRLKLRDGNQYAMTIVTSLSRLQKTQMRLLIICLSIIPAILVLYGFIGAWIAGRVLRPVMAVADTANKISKEDLSKRVSEEDVDDEMKYLIQSFNSMIERLEKSFEYISQFSAHAAHELKTPLAVMRGESEIALRKDRSPEEYREALEANLRESQRMIRVVEDMLYFSRLDHDPNYLDSKPLDPLTLLRDISEKARVLAERKQIRVEAVLPQQCGPVKGDENALRRLLLNLVDNAIKFTPAQGLLEIRAEAAPEKKLRIRVKDSGRGISASELPKIFDKFYHRDDSAETPGNGLGLSIAMVIAKAHGGDIRVESTPGQGTVFTVTLPLSS